MNQGSEPDDVTDGSANSSAVNGHKADRPPTEAEATAADEQFARDTDAQRADVAKHEKEMMELGAEVKGEGAID
jgi:hypothetical protein